MNAGAGSRASKAESTGSSAPVRRMLSAITDALAAISPRLVANLENTSEHRI